MLRFRRTLWLTPLLIVILACRAGAVFVQPTATTELLHISKAILPPATLTPTATSTSTPTPIPPTSTATPTLSPTLTVVPTPSAQQLKIFEELWGIVRDYYVYADYNGLDWELVGESYRMRIQAGLTLQDYYESMEALIASLKDEHSAYLRPEEALEEDAEFAGDNDYVGIGVITSVVEERLRAVILVVFPGSPAEEAGLQSHDSILAVDGEQLVTDQGFRRNLLRGPDGTTIELTVQSPGEQPRQVQLTRRRVTGSVPVPYQELITDGGKRVLYILVITLADETVDNQIEAALVEMTASGPLDGVILDQRLNSGGADNVTKAVLGFFTSGTMGHFIDRDNSRRAFNVIGTDINGSSEIPLVVMVGPDTVSFGEISSGVLKDNGRAVLIGETTEGNVELLWGYDFEDGSRAWIAHETFRPRNHPDENWEETGIIPDIEVPSEWDLITDETDPALQAALEYFDDLR